MLRNSCTKVGLKDGDYKNFEEDFACRFKIDDENFPKIDDDDFTDSDDSVVVSKHAFAVRRSGYDQKDVYNFNSVDRYANDDDDSDIDSDDSNKDENNTNDFGDQKINIPVDKSRSRASGLTIQANIDDLDDLDCEVEIEEIINNDMAEPAISNSDKDASDSDDNQAPDSNLENELMSPEGEKYKEDCLDHE